MTEIGAYALGIGAGAVAWLIACRLFTFALFDDTTIVEQKRASWK